jgi:hypothetical protein
MTKKSNSDPKDTTVASAASPKTKAGRKSIGGQKLCFSPRSKVPNVNKVFVVGTQLGIILIRTERQNNKDDAFTNNAIKMIEDEETGIATKLNIIKICSRRQSQLIDKAVLQSTGWHSQWFVSIVEEDKNTSEVRREHTDKFIQFLNEIEWKYPQIFNFSGCETKLNGNKIIGTWDMYLMSSDITSILKHYVFDDLGHFLEDDEAIHSVFGSKCTKDQARDYVKNAWIRIE